MESVEEIKKEDESSLYRWTPECVLLLLDTFKNIEERLNNGRQSQKKIWEEVSQTMRQNGHYITGPQCAAKLRSLKKTYKTIKDHNGKSGNSRKSWQFYEIMEQIFSKKAWCAPVAVASSSSLSVKLMCANDNSAFASQPEKSKASSAHSLLAKRLRQKDEHEEAKEKRHQQRMKMDERLLAALEKLEQK